MYVNAFGSNEPRSTRQRWTMSSSTPSLTTSSITTMLKQSSNDYDDDKNDDKKNMMMMSLYNVLSSTDRPSDQQQLQELESCRPSRPNKGNFFYNDEVISHLQGYMYLVGFLVAQDGLFVVTFIVVNAIAGAATQSSILPANPRIPAIVAIVTLLFTTMLRCVVMWDPVTEILQNSLIQEREGRYYDGPTDMAWMYEIGICTLNIGWGFFGTWRTKEPASDGATYGF